MTVDTMVGDPAPPNARVSAVNGLGPRSMSLRASLIWRVVVVAVACLCVAMVVVLVGSALGDRRRTEETADLVARHLALQRLRIDAGYDISSRFPDWDAVVDHLSASGQCVRFEDAEGRMLRSSCIGSDANDREVPSWFSAIHSLVFPRRTPAEQAVIYKDVTYGTVFVSSDATAAMSRSWRELTQMLALTGITVLSLCLLVYVVLERMLSQARGVVAGLDRLASGDFGHRLPGVRLTELQRIAEVSNQLAGKIETTLGERAELSRRLMNAQEQERQYLARELHDEFAQNLTAIGAMAASVEKAAGRDCPGLRDEARTLSGIASGMMTALRGTLLHLRPADLDRFGLVESLRQLVAVWNASSHQATRFELEAPCGLEAQSDEAAIHVFRIAQEALTNAARHADATLVRLRLQPFPALDRGAGQAAGVELTIEDDGRGRRDLERDTSGEGRGILNMRERVAALGGTISFEDRQPAGLTVCVRIPAAIAREEHKGAER